MVRLLSPVFLVLAVAGSTPCACAAGEKLDAVRSERLVNLCKVWGTVRYLHPYLAYKDIDWDAALLEALTGVEAAKDEPDYRAAVQGMLDRLGDPKTRVVRKALLPQANPAGGKDDKGRPLFSWVEKDVLAIHLDPPPSLGLLVDPGTREKLLAALGKASRVIIDVRGEDDFGFGAYVLSWLNPQLPSREVRAPAERYLVHSGYRPQSGLSSGGYFSAFQTALPELFKPSPGANGKRVVFLVAERTDLPPIALALQEAGDAFLVAQGKMPAAIGGGHRSVALTDGFEVRVRTSELLGASGPVQLHADAEVAADADRGPEGPAFKRALALLRDAPKATKSTPAPNGAPAPVGAWRPDKRYESMTYPDRTHRLLALFRFWNVIHYFYPYQHLLDQDWDTVLPRFLPQFAAAGDARDYALAVAEMAACIQDTHTRVTGSQELKRFFGEAMPPVGLRLVEGRPVITHIFDSAAVKDSGVEIGDVVLAIDGEPAAKRMARLGKYVAGSNPDAHARYVLYRLLLGPEDAPLKLTVQGRDDKARDVTLPRKAKYIALLAALRTGEVFKMLEDNIGYCDLERLTVDQVAAMLERFKDTRGIVFDLRGYPKGTAWSLAPRPRRRAKAALRSSSRCRPARSGNTWARPSR